MFPEMVQLEFKQPEAPKITDPGKSFEFDFAAGEFVLSDGKLVVIDGIEALKVWIEKIIRTERFRFKVYERNDGNEYGITLTDLIGTVLPRAFVEAELKREISQTVRRHPRIVGIFNLSTVRNDNWVNITFQINLIDGETLGQEVSIVG